MKDVLIWVGGAALIVIGVVALLWWTADEDNTLPETYAEEGYGIL
ncbi:MAG TPA: hypothetical protein QGF58_13960 [Myxococcota bacterium]|jgi:hypothetical protein|nr:hypothetical protein [Myxococcota bacterium]